ncbi:MAG: alpha/beta fold hydrolase [Christensenellales bacterium]
MFRPDVERKRFINSSHVGKYASIGDLRVHYMEQGVGEVILMIHGMGQSLYTWRNNIDELAKNYRVIILDLLGHGYSDKPCIAYTVDEMAEFLKLFMESISVSRASIVAFSTGSIYALRLAQQYPMAVNRLVLLAPGGLPNKTNQMWMNMVLSGTFSRLALSMFSEKKVYHTLMECFFDKTCVTDEVVEQYYLPLEDKGARHALADCISSFEVGDVMDNLRNMQEHVLLINGGDDPWRPMDEMDFFSNALPNSYLVQVRNCGHMLQEEKKDKINTTIQEFLEWNGRV